MVAKLDLTGKRFGRLFAVCSVGKTANHSCLWRCRCDCGKEIVTAVGNLRSGNSQSCGCGHGLALSNPITHAQLKKLVRYIKSTGEFIARRKWHRIKVGQPIGSVDINSGYKYINIGGETYYGHVLAWFYVKKTWPKVSVDHENRNRSDNRWKNLRLASGGQNNANHPVRKDSRSGFKGVTQYCRNPLLWKAYIIKNRKQKILGYEDNPEAAARLYDQAAIKLHGRFARTNFGERRARLD